MEDENGNGNGKTKLFENICNNFTLFYVLYIRDHPGAGAAQAGARNGYNTNKGVNMPIRKVPLVNGETYHIFNKSIAGFKIFDDNKDCDRMMELLSFYTAEKVPCCFSTYKKLRNIEIRTSQCVVDIIAYCLMPTHIHLVLTQRQNDGIEKFISSISQSYTQYFNIRRKRKGPLWEGRFGNTLVKDDNQLLHLTRYVHLNPVTAFLVNGPGDWKYSSYSEYMKLSQYKKPLCNFSGILKIDPASYKEFVADQIDYQRQLAIIKYIALDD